jgi:hypothetical protein
MMSIPRTFRRAWPLAAVSVAALTAAAAAQPQPRAAARPRGPVLVTARTVEKGEISGSLVELTLSDGAVMNTDSSGREHLAAADLVRLTTTTSLSRQQTGAVTLTLLGGDTLNGKIAAGDADTVTIETADIGKVRVPLDSVRSLRGPRASDPAQRESAVWFDRTQTGNVDRILLTNGDVADGFIAGIDAEGITIDGTFGTTKLPHRLVVAARLAAAPPTPLDGLQCRVTLRRSGRLTMTRLDWMGATVEARLRHGQQVEIEPARIVAIDIVGGRWEWLSSHRPISYEHTPMLALDWEYARDRNVLGGPIRVAGETFEHGVGVHSRSSLTYDLKGVYKQFVTSFGIDDDSGPYADVSVFILVDGKRRFEQVNVRPGKLFGPVRLDVTKANRIQLVVDFGDNGDLQDRLNWIEPALIR